MQHYYLAFFSFSFVYNTADSVRINVKLRRLRQTLLQWESSKYYLLWVCV